MELGLEGKVAIVTGGSKGIGRATALGLAQEGANVAICARGVEDLEMAAAEISELTGRTILPVRADMTMLEDIQNLVATTVAELGGVDILVNNAVNSVAAPFLELSDEDWLNHINVKVMGYVRCSREVVPPMERGGGGRIINIASVSGLYGGPTTAHYAASKAGLISLTQVLARWGAEHNILVNSISPGIIETELTREELRSGGGAGVVALTLLKRPGEVNDVSSIAVMLASDEQNYMTGQTISPNGGSYFTD